MRRQWKLYIASAFANKEEVRAAMTLARDAGHSLTHDWTVYDAGDLTGLARTEYLENCGRADFDGVYRADALIVLAHPDMRDTLCEMGIALGRGVPVIVVNPDKRHSVFYGKCGRVCSVEGAMSMLEDL